MSIDVLSLKQVAFEIRSAPGQAGAAYFISGLARSPKARLEALEVLASIITAQFELLTMKHEHTPTWDQTFFVPARACDLDLPPVEAPRRRWTD